jgi:predicted RNA binding protein YcfA (HicA-like mRNA interferase family)
MTKRSKIINKILLGTSDQNIDFIDLTGLLLELGFECRIRGSHHIFYKNDIEEIINIQPKQDNKAKLYQVKQIRNLILKYNLNTENNEA